MDIAITGFQEDKRRSEARAGEKAKEEKEVFNSCEAK